MLNNKQLEWVDFRKRSSLFAPRVEDKPFVSNRVVKIPVSAIDTSSLRARKRFDEVAILTLADSIRRHGLLQPILVNRSEKGLHEKTHYICVVGEKRLRAFKMLGRQEIPCLVLSSRLVASDALALTENLVRSDLDMFELGTAFAEIANQCSLTQEELATYLSTSSQNVANKIQLLSLEPEEQMFVLENGLSERHALTLLRIKDVVLRKKVAKLIAERHYTEKRAEEYIDIILSDLLPFSEMADKDDDLESFVGSLSCSLNLLRKNGFATQCERFDHEDEIQFLIRIPKK